MLAVLALVFLTVPIKAEDIQYGNVTLIVWQLETSSNEACAKMNTPIPEVFSSSWLHEMIAFRLAPEAEKNKVLSKGNYSFFLSATAEQGLNIKVLKRGGEFLEFNQKIPSSAKYIFYGEGSRPYMLEVLYTLDSGPVPLLSPGILKRF